MYSKEFYQKLLHLAQDDLSQAHLRQHFTTAQSYITAYGSAVDGQATWSAAKPQDTLIYNNGTVTGKKYWVSGVEKCNWVVAPAKDDKDLLLVIIPTKDLKIIPNPTMGMEDTLTVHFECNSTPVRVLGNRLDHRARAVAHAHGWCFITNHLGLAIAAFNDIDIYTKNVAMFDYNKDKIRLDLEILKLLWTNELEMLGNQTWDRDSLVYAFAKKIVIQLAQLITEITGSGLFEINQLSHQRYKDILIYSTHMRNTAAAIQDLKYFLN
jgi:hypothetical protein